MPPPVCVSRLPNRNYDIATVQVHITILMDVNSTVRLRMIEQLPPPPFAFRTRITVVSGQHDNVRLVHPEEHVHHADIRKLRRLSRMGNFT